MAAPAIVGLQQGGVQCGVSPLSLPVPEARGGTEKSCSWLAAELELESRTSGLPFSILPAGAQAPG